MPLPNWMRNALFATAAMNIVGSVLFFPSAGALRRIAGMPQVAHPLYLATVAMFVALFGVGYLWTAVVGRADRMFITLAAIGKLSFFSLLVWLWAGGALPLRAPFAGSGDLVFGLLFVRWLYGAQPALTAGAQALRART